jgi:hypothetical protein
LKKIKNAAEESIMKKDIENGPPEKIEIKEFVPLMSGVKIII